VTSRTLNGEIRAYLYVDLTSMTSSQLKRQKPYIVKTGLLCNFLTI
jgi:hypothetical protein